MLLCLANYKTNKPNRLDMLIASNRSSILSRKSASTSFLSEIKTFFSFWILAIDENRSENSKCGCVTNRIHALNRLFTVNKSEG